MIITLIIINNCNYNNNNVYNNNFDIKWNSNDMHLLHLRVLDIK